MRSLISVVPVPARVPGVRERPASESQSQAELRDRNSQTVRQAGWSWAGEEQHVKLSNLSGTL